MSIRLLPAALLVASLKLALDGCGVEPRERASSYELNREIADCFAIRDSPSASTDPRATRRSEDECGCFGRDPLCVPDAGAVSDRARACHALAQKWDRGSDGPKDPSRARQLYQLACEIGHPAACNRLGLMLALGEGGTSDAVEAKRYFATACSKEYGFGCANLGTYWEWGEGGAENRRRARDALRKACRLGVRRACKRAGCMRAWGWGQ